MDDWLRFCRLVREAQKDIWAVVNRLWKRGEDQLAEDVFEVATGQVKIRV
jgi:hypothetical protein